MLSKSFLLALLPSAFAAPLLVPRDATLIANKYIVKLVPGTVESDANDAKSHLTSAPDFEYDFGDFKGFAGHLSDDAVAKLQASGTVEWIQQDAQVHTQAYQVESGAPWGLGRISHVAKGNTNYVYDSSAGAGTCAYVIDTGIYVDHPEFQGRATWLENFSGDGDDTDGNGHGTHVAGTIGSKTYGVAKKTQLYAVKVLDASGSGTNSGVIAGINFVANDAQTRNCPKGAVANMSLGGSKSTAVNQAVAAAVSSGVFFGVAAGNDNQDAKNSSPASEPSACTVGATDINDARASFSNYGSIVDIFAPGVNILSTWNDGSTNTISGTSMATPHIVGLAAYLLAFENLAGTDVCARIDALSTRGKITSLPSGTKNYLAYNGAPSSASA